MKFPEDPWVKFSFYDVIGEKTKACCLNLTYDLIVTTICIPGKMGIILGKNFCGIYRCWLQKVVIKLYQITRFTFFEGWVGGLYKVLNFHRRVGDYQNRTSANKGKGGPNLGHFVITECPLIQKSEDWWLKL